MGLKLKKKLKSSVELPDVYARIGRIEYHTNTQVLSIYFYPTKADRDEHQRPELIRDYEFDTSKETRKSLYKELIKSDDFKESTEE